MAQRPRETLTIRGLVTAARFLTVVPVPGRSLEGLDALGRAAGWFPVVGLALGLMLVVVDRVLSLAFQPAVAALLLVVVWKFLTGGIHLDGLADSLDGLTGRSPAERRAIMRDSRIGVFAAIGLIFVLLLDFTTLADLPLALRDRALLLAPAVGRLAPLYLARRFSPATPGEGSGAAFMTAVTPKAIGLWALVVALAAVVMLWPWGLLALGVGLAFAWGLGRFLSSRLGGLTGDSLGAAVEVAELGVLLAFASFHHLGLVP